VAALHRVDPLRSIPAFLRLGAVHVAFLGRAPDAACRAEAPRLPGSPPRRNRNLEARLTAGKAAAAQVLAEWGDDPD